MLIEIESVYGDKIIHGRHLDMNKLKSAIDEILKTVNEENFVFAFCSRYQYRADDPQKCQRGYRSRE